MAEVLNDWEIEIRKDVVESSADFFLNLGIVVFILTSVMRIIFSNEPKIWEKIRSTIRIKNLDETEEINLRLQLLGITLAISMLLLKSLFFVFEQSRNLKILFFIFLLFSISSFRWLLPLVKRLFANRN